MKLPLYQIDAFTHRVFSGNPAAVCPLQTWLDDFHLQAIARENNLSETAFFAVEGDQYRIRWFTPLTEVDLCGHATLASAHVIFTHFDPGRAEISFLSRSGTLKARRDQGLLSIDLPARTPLLCGTPKGLLEGLKREPVEVLCSEDYLAVFSSEKEIAELKPDPEKLETLDRRGVIVTAKGDTADFVSRFFAPKLGITEDPVTGSAHCALTPYWAKKLRKTSLHALQLSARGGELYCEDRGKRVVLSGRAVPYLEGLIQI